MGRLMTIQETSEYLGGTFTVSVLYARVHRRQIPFVKIEGRLFFDRRQLDRWIDANTVKVAS